MTLAQIINDLFHIGTTITESLAFIIILSLALIIAWIGHFIFKRYVQRWAKTTDTKLDDNILKNIRAPIFLLALILGCYYGLEQVTAIQDYTPTISQIFTICGILIVGFIITRTISIFINWYDEQSTKKGKEVSDHIIFILKRVIQIIVFSVALLAILGVLGIGLDSIVVGLGVGGIAIALALQNVLTDLFSAFSIYFDRPFEIGDTIVIGEHTGTVKKVGIRSTRIKLLQGEELIISNKELLSQEVRNFKKLKKRRVQFTLTIDNNTPTLKLEKMPNIIKQVIDQIKLAIYDRVHFKEFGSFGLNFEIVYYINTGDYKKYMDIQEQINYGILKQFEKEKINMPYPTQQVIIENKK